MKKFGTLFICLTFFFATQGQNRKLDSLYTLLKIHPEEDTTRVRLLYMICFHEYTSDNEKNKIHAEEALRIATKLNYTRGIGMALRYKALYHSIQGENALATKYAFEMLKVFEGTKFVAEMGSAYHLIGMIYLDSEDFGKSKFYLLKALDIRQKAGQQDLSAYSLNSLGALAFKKGNYDEALSYFLKALEIRKTINNQDGLSQSYVNLATTYEKKKDYILALSYYQKAEEILDITNNKYRKTINYCNLGETHMSLGNYDRAKFYLLKSLVIAKDIKNKTALVNIYCNLAEVEKRKGNYQTALANLELRNVFNDSIFTEEKAKQIAEIETRYETEKKDRVIQQLETQKELQIVKQLYLVIGLLVVVIASVVIYLLQRSHSKRVQALLETQRSLNQELHEADQVKSRFFANISHEFRTPLSLILAPIEEKIAIEKNPKERESFMLVRRNAKRLLTLVNQLLDLSKLEAKKMELHVQRGDLRKFLAILIASFDSWAENKKIRFSKSIDLRMEEAWFDADKLEKVITNLLSNAFKFTPQGGAVTLSVYASIPDHHLIIEIADTGKGIPDGEQQKIFSPFYQSRMTGDDTSPGTGLGLSLVKELVKLYDGKIELHSSLNEGTIITVTLPMMKEKFSSVELAETASLYEPPILLDIDGHVPLESVEATDYELEAVHENTVLVVEDNSDLRDFVSSIMGKQFKVLAAVNGEEGYALAVERMPNIIISDVMMPVMDGIQLTEKIKSDERTCHIPVILLTAKADLKSRVEGFKTGADDYLSKPFSTEELLARVDNMIEQRKKLAIKYKANLSLPVTSIKEASMDEKFLMKARQIVVDNIGNASFGVEQMAEEIFLSRAQLFRKLKAISGLSPNEFINDIRLQRAAELIRAKADTLTQISYSVGYNEQSYFAKRFRKKYGVTPSEYSTTG